MWQSEIWSDIKYSIKLYILPEWLIRWRLIRLESLKTLPQMWHFFSPLGSVMRFLKKNFKSCQPIAENSFINWYHANFWFSLASNLFLKPFYLTWGFDIFFSSHWLYLGIVDTFLSVSDTRTWELMFSCLIMINIKEVYVV